jgi:hypothetical protein
MAKILILTILAIIPLITVAQNHRAVFTKDSLSIILSKDERAVKFISRTLKRFPNSKALSIKFKKTGWIGYGFVGDDVMEIKKGPTLSAIPEAISALKNLQRLYLVGLNLNNIPKSVTQLHNLTLIDLSFNQLSNIEIKKIEGLKQLRILKIYGQSDLSALNDLKAFNPNLKDFLRLKTLMVRQATGTDANNNQPWFAFSFLPISFFVPK